MISVVNPPRFPSRSLDPLAVYAKAKAGDFGAPSASEPVRIALPPGRFDLGTDFLMMDSNYIDVIGAGRDRTELVASVGSAVVVMAATNTRLRGVTAINSYGPSGFGIMQGTGLTSANSLVERCRFTSTSQNTLNNKLHGGGSSLYGLFRDCEFGGFDIVGVATREAKATARLERCTFIGGSGQFYSPLACVVVDSTFTGAGHPAEAPIGSTFINCLFDMANANDIESPDGCSFINCTAIGGTRAVDNPLFILPVGSTNTIVGGGYYVAGAGGIFWDLDFGATVQVAGNPLFSGNLWVGDVPPTFVGAGHLFARSATAPEYESELTYDPAADAYEGKRGATAVAFDTTP
jgi:hypothetical protein